MIPPLFTKVEKAVQQNQQFFIDKTDVKIFDKMGFVERIFSGTYSTENDFELFSNNAKLIANALKTEPRHDNWDQASVISRISKIIKSFLRNYAEYDFCSHYINCNLELQALRLGLDADILRLKINEGFTEFAKDIHLHNSLLTYNHLLGVDKDTNEILIKYQNRYTLWSQVKNIIANYETLQNDEPYDLKRYSYTGIVNENRFGLDKLKPFLKGNTKKWSNYFIKNPKNFDSNNNFYGLEICSTAKENYPRFIGDHTWIRLYKLKKTDKKIVGKMYSIGLYRPYKHNIAFDTLVMPFCLKKGYIAEEISEVWGINHEIITLPFQINEASYSNIKKKINDDLQSTNIVYHLLLKNCDHYAHTIAKIAGINLPTKEHVLKVYTCVHLQDFLTDKINTLSPKARFSIVALAKVIQGIMIAMTPIFNLFFFMMGAGLIRKNVKLTPKIKAPISCLSDFFRLKKLYSFSPWILAHPVKQRVESWRKKEGKDCHETQYAIPPFLKKPPNKSIVLINK